MMLAARLPIVLVAFFVPSHKNSAQGCFSIAPLSDATAFFIS